MSQGSVDANHRLLPARYYVATVTVNAALVTSQRQHHRCNFCLHPSISAESGKQRKYCFYVLGITRSVIKPSIPASMARTQPGPALGRAGPRSVALRSS